MARKKKNKFEGVEERERNEGDQDKKEINCRSKLKKVGRRREARARMVRKCPEFGTVRMIMLLMIAIHLSLVCRFYLKNNNSLTFPSHLFSLFSR